MKVYYMICSYELIPEVMLFKTVEDLKQAWIESCPDYMKTEDAEESFHMGYASWHDVELRWGAEYV